MKNSILEIQIQIHGTSFLLVMLNIPITAFALDSATYLYMASRGAQTTAMVATSIDAML